MPVVLRSRVSENVYRKNTHGQDETDIFTKYRFVRTKNERGIYLPALFENTDIAQSVNRTAIN